MNWVIFSTKDFAEVCSKKTEDFAFDKPFSNQWWVAGREVSVLESSCGLKMCADIKDCSLVKSFAFERVVSRKFISLSEFSAVNLIE